MRLSSLPPLIAVCVPLIVSGEASAQPLIAGAVSIECMIAIWQLILGIDSLIRTLLTPDPAVTESIPVQNASIFRETPPDEHSHKRQGSRL